MELLRQMQGFWHGVHIKQAARPSYEHTSDGEQ
jgi:hypothetical protein